MPTAPATSPSGSTGARPHTAAADRRRSFGASNLSGLATLYLLSLRQQLHGRRWMVMGLVFLACLGLSLLLRATATEVPPQILEFLVAMMFLPQALLPLIALLYASGMILDEQEEQTITYLLIRPIPKWAFYLVKLAATLTTTVILTVLLTLMTYAAIYLGADNGPENILGRAITAAAIHSLAVIAYCCLFGLMSLLVKRILVVGVIYTAVVEAALANLPFGIRLVTVIYYTRLIAYRALPFVVAKRNRTENLSAEAWQLDVVADPNLLEHPQLGTCLAVLLGGSVVCAALGAWICSRREFHVKTPEKG